MSTHRVRRFEVLLVSVLTCVVAEAQVGGGGSAATDCWVAFQSNPTANTPAVRPKYVRCRDQDATCGDADPVLGQCTFQVRVGLNVSGFPSCTPRAFPAGSFAIPYSGPAFDDHPKHVPDFEPFQLFADGQLPLLATETDRWSGWNTVRVVLPVRQAANGPRFRLATLKLQTTICGVSLLSDGKCPAGVANDKDTFKLVCLPPVDPLTNAPVSPCTGITSTFEQIQKHIFDRKCSNLATCHGFDRALSRLVSRTFLRRRALGVHRFGQCHTPQLRSRGRRTTAGQARRSRSQFVVPQSSRREPPR